MVICVYDVNACYANTPKHPISSVGFVMLHMEGYGDVDLRTKSYFDEGLRNYYCPKMQ